jgi:hypothetical protein
VKEMISIDGVECSGKDETCILMALYHYQLICKDEGEYMNPTSKRVNKLIYEIINLYPEQ